MPDPPSAAAAQPPLGRSYVVSGRRLALHRDGSGAPPVIFLPGAGLVGLDYLNVQTQVAKLTTSVIYDRAGTGWSDPVSLPRSASAVAEELHALLSVAEIGTPVVLVGHSLGGAYARRYAQLFPAEVAALLLLDPFHEDLYRRAPQKAREKLAEMHGREMPDPTAEQLRAGREAAGRLFATWPDQVRDALVEHHVTAAWRAGMQEDRDLYDDVAEELRTGSPLRDIPIIVLTALGDDETQAALWEPEVLRAINEAKTSLHADLAASVSQGEQRIIYDAGHGWLHEQRQAEIVELVDDLLRRST
jgi:pimeloyl-ACP methyl ester carboxylesterase